MNNKINSKVKQRVNEFFEKVLEVRRVTRVVAGGKRMSFRAVMVIGDKKGRVGIGIGKGLDVALAVSKAKRQAEKNIISINLKDERTIPYEINEKYKSSIIRLKPAKKYHGLIAGGSSRIVLEMAGVKDVSAKILGRTTNKLTNAMATLKALKKIKKIEEKAKEENLGEEKKEEKV
jgi:small subunit ribosomal protein S5